jgi:hypothetical protein
VTESWGHRVEGKRSTAFTLKRRGAFQVCAIEVLRAVLLQPGGNPAD